MLVSKDFDLSCLNISSDGKPVVGGEEQERRETKG